MRILLSVILIVLTLPSSAAAIRVGYNDDGDRLAALPKALEYANVKVARFGVSWAVIEQADDQFDFTDVDETVAALDRVGVRPMLAVIGTPSWAGPYAPGIHCAPDHANNDEWEEIWRVLALRYPQAILSVWNEPNLKAYGDLKVQRAAELANLAARAVWSVSPGRRVLGPAASPGESGWVTYMRSMYGLIDPGVELATNIYPYGDVIPDFRLYVREMDRLAGNRELWITETGASRSVISPRAQKRFVRRAYDYARQRGAKSLVFHRLWSPHYGDAPPHDWDAGLSALRADGTPTSLYRQIAHLGLDGPPPKGGGNSPPPIPPQPADPDVDSPDSLPGCSG